jgi:apolipoprotein N-acyltransferase
MTRIHREQHEDGLAEFLIEERLQAAVMKSHARFLVFPEAAVRHWTEATDAFWSPRLDRTQKTLLIGASQSVPGSSRYYNSVVIVGKEPRDAVHQRIPVPGGMWNRSGRKEPLHPISSALAQWMWAASVPQF